MNKIELAKMIGLEAEGINVYEWQIRDCLDSSWFDIKFSFCDEKIIVSVDQDDFTKDKLDITEEDLVEEGDIKACIKQVEDLLWERAADKYLEMVHDSAMLIGGKG